jgi:hypothetical protein
LGDWFAGFILQIDLAALVPMSERGLTGHAAVGLSSSNRRSNMIRTVFGATFLAAAAIAPLSASAQGVPGDVEQGSREGERAAGPVGAIVGGTIGGVVGGVSGILGVEAGVTYYAVPPEYGVRDYRYTVVNDRPVLVDPIRAG